jgi:predicted dehydrogenase
MDESTSDTPPAPLRGAPPPPIRWGILATGGIARALVEDLQLAPDAEVVAVGSRAQATADAFAQRYGIARAYGDWRSLAADAQVDVVYVATPHSAHHEATKLCLAAGRAVLCEKPITLDEPSARDLFDTARAGGRFLMEAMWTRCNPTIRRVAELVADGAIGEVTAVHADFGIAGPFEPSHRLRDPALGGSALLDLGIYPITLAHLLLGRPDTIEVRGQLTPEGVDQQTGLLFGYGSGALAVLSCGFVGATGNVATVTGTTGRIELPAPFHCPRRLTLRRGDTEEVIESPLAGHGYLPEIEEVHRCLRAGLTESPLVPATTTLEVMSIMDSIRERIGVSYEPV